MTVTKQYSVKNILTGLVQYSDGKESSDIVIISIHRLVLEAQRRGGEVLSSIDIILNRIKEEDKKKSFYTVFDSLFEDGIKWSQVIVALMYMIEVLKLSKSEYPKYFEWSVDLICKKIDPWIQENGGWESFTHISNNRVNLDETVKRIGTVVLGISGLIALGKWLLN